MAAKKVLMVLTNHSQIAGTDIATGYYLPEAAHPYMRFKKAGFEVQWASPSGGNTVITPASIDLNDEENKVMYTTVALFAAFHCFASPLPQYPLPTPGSLLCREPQAFFEDAALRADTENTKPLSEFRGDDFDIVFFVGGFGVM